MILLLLALLVKSTYVRYTFFYKFTSFMPKKRIPQKWNALFRDYAFSVLVTIGSMALLFLYK